MLRKRSYLYAAAAATFLFLFYHLRKPLNPPEYDGGRLEAYMNNGDADMRSKSPSPDTVQSSFEWSNVSVRYVANTMTPLPSGKPRTLPRIQHVFSSESKSATFKREKRRQEVKKAFQRCWRSYKEHAWMRDELKPITREGQDTFGGW